MKRNYGLIVALAILLCSCTRATAQPSARILFPRMTRPAVVVLDESPSFLVDHVNESTVDSIALSGPAEFSSEGNVLMIIPHPSGYSETAISLADDMPSGLYTISVTTTLDGEKVTETIPRSVWVMAHAPESLVFAHVSDSHTGDPRAAMAPSVETPDQRREKVFKAACDSGADFVVITGDLVSIPGNYKKEYKQAYKEIEDYISCPLYVVPGNHDLYTTHATKGSVDGWTFWTRYFGDDRYSFDIGKYAFIVTNSYDWPRKYRNFMNQPLMKQVGSYSSGAMSLAQLHWIIAVLESYQGKNIIVFGHHLFRDYSTKNGSIVELANPDDVLGVLAKYGVKYYFAGHNHRNTRETVNGVTLSTVVSAASDIPEDASWGFDKCTIEDDDVACEFVPVVERTD